MNTSLRNTSSNLKVCIAILLLSFPIHYDFLKIQFYLTFEIVSDLYKLKFSSRQLIENDSNGYCVILI